MSDVNKLCRAPGPQIAFMELVRRLVVDAKRKVTHAYFGSDDDCLATMTCVRTYHPAIKHMIETYSSRVRMADSVDSLFFGHSRSKDGATYENKYAMTGPVDLDLDDYHLYMTILSNSTGRVYSLFIYDHDSDDRVLRSVHSMCTEFARRTADENETEWLNELEYVKFPRLVGDRNDGAPESVSKAAETTKGATRDDDDGGGRGGSKKVEAQVRGDENARRVRKKNVKFEDELRGGIWI